MWDVESKNKTPRDGLDSRGVYSNGSGSTPSDKEKSSFGTSAGLGAARTSPAAAHAPQTGLYTRFDIQPRDIVQHIRCELRFARFFLACAFDSVFPLFVQLLCRAWLCLLVHYYSPFNLLYIQLRRVAIVPLPSIYCAFFLILKLLHADQLLQSVLHDLTRHTYTVPNASGLVLNWDVFNLPFLTATVP